MRFIRNEAGAVTTITAMNCMASGKVARALSSERLWPISAAEVTIAEVEDIPSDIADDGIVSTKIEELLALQRCGDQHVGGGKGAKSRYAGILGEKP